MDDEIDYHVLALCRACRIGDYTEVRKLIGLGVKSLRNLNAASCRDPFGNSPLYLACLCGHSTVTDYLLKHGAQHDPRTIEGQRCRLAALHQGIRDILRQHRVMSLERQLKNREALYLESLKSIYTCTDYHDITLQLGGGETVTADRCVLACRGFQPDVLQSISADTQQGACLDLSRMVDDVTVMKQILQLLYTGHLQIDVEDVYRLEDHLQMFDLEALRIRLIKAYDGFVKKFKNTNRDVPITVLKPTGTCNVGGREDIKEIQQAFGNLAKRGIPACLLDQEELALPGTDVNTNWFHDVCFQVDGHLFFGHKLLFTTRSDYFTSVMNDPFGEIRPLEDHPGKIPCVQVSSLSPTVFLYIMLYIYQDLCQPPVDMIEDVLYAADLVGLDGLKQMCAAVMAENLDADNVIGCCKLTFMFELPNLYKECVKYFADNTTEVCVRPEFGELLKEEAPKAESEQYDTLPVIQDILDQIKCNVGGFDDRRAANEKFKILNQTLSKCHLQRFKFPLAYDVSAVLRSRSREERRLRNISRQDGATSHKMEAQTLTESKSDNSDRTEAKKKHCPCM